MNSLLGLSFTHTKTKHVLVLLGCLFLAACSDDEPTPNVDPAMNGGAEQATSAAAVETIPFVALDLPSTPLDKQAFLGLKIPEVKEAEPCPYLSDEAALATTSKDIQLKRRDTSNKGCYWSKNLGFSVTLTIEPLATAKPIKDRAYNLEFPPVLKDQATPGSNAVVLYDTAWDKELAYAIAFEKDNKLVMIKVMGLPTDAALLTTAAQEVANKLSTATIAEQQTSDDDALDMCATWAVSDIENIMGSAVKTTKAKLDCKWETGADEDLKQIRVAIYSGKYYPWESMLERGFREVPNLGERSLMEVIRKKPKMPSHVLLRALYEETFVTVTVTKNIANHEEVALALMNNIDSRF